jgi:hypothetical protein
MAKLSISDEIAALIKAGDVLVSNNKFEDENGEALLIRSMESTSDPLEVGDIISVPTDYKVLKTKFSDDADAKAYPYIITEVKSVDGSERNFRFFPNSLCKTVWPIVNNVRQAKVKTSGTASDLYRTKTTIDEGLALLRGRQIKVADVQSYEAKEYGLQTTKTKHIYQYDLV